MTIWVNLIFVLLIIIFFYAYKSKSSSVTIKKIWLVLSIIGVFFLLFYVGQLVTFTYNYKYNQSAKILTESIIKSLENGQSDAVLKELKDLNNNFATTYMNNTDFNNNARRISENLKEKIKK